MTKSSTSRTDPVCGMTVIPGDEADRVEHADSEYLFCSTSCADKFRADPECYLKGDGGDTSNYFESLVTRLDAEVEDRLRAARAVQAITKCLPDLPSDTATVT